MQEIERLKKRVNTAKTTIILVAVLTIANTVLIAINADMVFTFSAYIPQFVTFLFADLAADLQDKTDLYIGVAIAILMALIYVALWFGAKKKDSFIAVALVLFGIDTAFMLYFDVIVYFDISSVIDILFHGWVVFDLIMGIHAYSKLKKMPAEEMQHYSIQTETYNPLPADIDSEYDGRYTYDQADSSPIRVSENKGRVIMSVDYKGMNVEVRRSMGLTELIVNGKVYAEKKGIIETNYTISARVSGVEFSTTLVMHFDKSIMYLYADGQQIAEKIRLA